MQCSSSSSQTSSSALCNSSTQQLQRHMESLTSHYIALEEYFVCRHARPTLVKGLGFIVKCAPSLTLHAAKSSRPSVAPDLTAPMRCRSLPMTRCSSSLAAAPARCPPNCRTLYQQQYAPPPLLALTCIKCEIRRPKPLGQQCCLRPRRGIQSHFRGIRQIQQRRPNVGHLTRAAGVPEGRGQAVWSTGSGSEVVVR